MLASQVKTILILLVISFVSGSLCLIILKKSRTAINEKLFIKRWLVGTYLAGVIALTLLPLPGPNDFLPRSEPQYLLMPLTFLKRVGLHLLANPPWTYRPPVIGILFEDVLMQPILNVALMLPLGFYLRYDLQWPTKRILGVTFAFSLTIELLQLTGLLFLYERPYRLFEVDDLLTNTFGGACGIWLSDWLQGRHKKTKAALKK